jgi:transcriptional regulator with XRE-family HTH domain
LTCVRHWHNIMSLMKRVGQNVKRRRLKLGLTQQALADRVGTSRIYVAQIEAASKEISLTMLDRVAKALRMKPGTLLQ